MLPSFIGLGAAKAGTSSIRRYLNQHPDVFVPRREPRFFSFEGQTLGTDNPVHRDTITTLQDYEALFGEASADMTVGEPNPAMVNMVGLLALDAYRRAASSRSGAPVSSSRTRSSR